MSGPPKKIERNITLIEPPEWCYQNPKCPVCAGVLWWHDCGDLKWGCFDCHDCGARYAVRVVTSSGA